MGTNSLNGELEGVRLMNIMNYLSLNPRMLKEVVANAGDLANRQK